MTEACHSHGGFYLGSIGGPAARLAQDCIKSVDVLEYPELGMEAVWKIEVEDFPAFIVVDDKGNDFFTDPSGAVTVPITGLTGALGGEVGPGSRRRWLLLASYELAAIATSSYDVPRDVIRGGCHSDQNV